MPCDDHRIFNNFLQFGHRKNINPKIRSPIIRSAAIETISLRIEPKVGIYDKKTSPITTNANPFNIPLHFFGLINIFSPSS